MRFINNYLSEIDELLIKLEKKFPQKSAARIVEEKKYQRIYALRDYKKNNIQ